MYYYELSKFAKLFITFIRSIPYLNINVVNPKVVFIALDQVFSQTFQVLPKSSLIRQSHFLSSFPFSFDVSTDLSPVAERPVAYVAELSSK